VPSGDIEKGGEREMVGEGGGRVPASSVCLPVIRRDEVKKQR